MGFVILCGSSMLATKKSINCINMISTMNKFDYKGIDLHALQVLKLIYGTGNLSTVAQQLDCNQYGTGNLSSVAQQLDCNQSTVSYTLERLRQAFNDPLFVRSGHLKNVRSGRALSPLVDAKS